LRDPWYLEVRSGGLHQNRDTDSGTWLDEETPFMEWDRKPGHYEEDHGSTHFETDVAERSGFRTVIVDQTLPEATEAGYLLRYVVTYDRGEILPLTFEAERHQHGFVSSARIGRVGP
jgi:hypothetical protein